MNGCYLGDLTQGHVRHGKQPEAHGWPSLWFALETRVLWTWSASEVLSETVNVLLLTSSCFRNLEKGAACESIS